MAIVSGKLGRLFLSVGTGQAVPVANVTSIDISMSTEQQEVTALGNTNKVFITGLPDGSMTFSGYYDTTDTTLMAAVRQSKAGVASKFYAYPDYTNNQTQYLYGTAWVDASLSIKVNGPAELRGSLRAAGDWGDKLA